MALNFRFKLIALIGRFKMKYFIIIQHKGEIAVLFCDSYNEALQTKQAFINYGKYENVRIQIEY